MCLVVKWWKSKNIIIIISEADPNYVDNFFFNRLKCDTEPTPPYVSRNQTPAQNFLWSLIKV